MIEHVKIVLEKLCANTCKLCKRTYERTCTICMQEVRNKHVQLCLEIMKTNLLLPPSSKIIEHSLISVRLHRLVRCLFCDSLTEWSDVDGNFKRNGVVYQLIKSKNKGPFEHDKVYGIPMLHTSKNY